MKSQFLVFKNIAAPEEGLRIADREEWTQIMKENTACPYCKRRFFITDEIHEGKERDRIYIEASKTEYDKWNRTRMADVRNNFEGQKFMMISGNVIVSLDGTCVFDTITDGMQSMEENVHALISLEHLRNALAMWKYWALDMFDIYLAGEKKMVVEILSQCYGVTPQMARNWRADFKKFVAKYYADNA